jgi:demethylmenaquinone methyltransferase/2-methoxy-6-polyprenyl-1,4-benzoquinol methylase
VENWKVIRANLDKQPHEVAKMFDDVAARYDLVNDILSFGQTRLWRKATVKASRARVDDKVLDIAAGTGTSSLAFGDSGAFVVPMDFSFGMLAAGKAKNPGLPFIQGDALALPFLDNAFDVVTISFGIRNVHNTGRALEEMLRVTKPAGRLVICEFSHPANPQFRTLYFNYLMKALPEVAKRTASNPEAYVYLAESISQWPTQSELAAEIEHSGWANVSYQNLTGGIVAIHSAIKPN